MLTETNINSKLRPEKEKSEQTPIKMFKVDKIKKQVSTNINPHCFNNV